MSINYSFNNGINDDGVCVTRKNDADEAETIFEVRKLSVELGMMRVGVGCMVADRS